MSEEERFGPDPDELGERIRSQIERGLRRGMRHGLRHGMGNWTFGVEAGDEAGSEASEVEERRFAVAGMPKVRLANVSGRTEVAVGAPGEVVVRARKYVQGWSEERAKRLLENIEIVFEQHGDEIVVEPRLFQQERGWLDLFRGGRVAVDLDVRVPREAHVVARSVSGEVSVVGLRGSVDLQSVSGEVEISDVQGPLHVRTVSGDVDLSAYAGRLEANSTSGDVRVQRSRVRTPDVVTVSGDVSLDAVFLGGPAGECRCKTVSGDIDLALGEPDAEVEFRTVSGDTEVELVARVEKVSRRDRRIVVGAGGPQVRVKTVSGDLTIRSAGEAPPEAETPAAESVAVPMGAPAAEAAAPAEPDARAILERLARGELSVDEAAAALDVSRSS